MGIHRKVLFGFIVVGFILFLSGLVSIFEVTRMRDKVSGVLSDNVDALLNTKRIETDVANYADLLLKNLQAETLDTSFFAKHEKFHEDYFEKLNNSHLSINYSSLLDSLYNAYDLYIAVVEEAPGIWGYSENIRTNWISNRFRPAYIQLHDLLEHTMEMSQRALEKNSQEIESGFYRSIMPGVIATCAGILLVILFNYFINLYIVTPVLRITKGVNAYLSNRIPYTVEAENEDEIQELNHAIKTLISEYKSLAKSKQQ